MKIERGYPTYTVTPKAENAIVKGHPWVYDAEILNIEGETANGGLVDVISRKGRYLGTGFLSQHSPRSGCGSSRRNANDRFDEAFWRRRSCNAPGTTARPSWARRIWTACRVIFGEADALPRPDGGPVRHDLLSVQVLSVGMEQLARTSCYPLWWTFCGRTAKPSGAYFERNDVALRDKEGLPQGKGWYPLPRLKHPRSSPVTGNRGKRRATTWWT